MNKAKHRSGVHSPVFMQERRAWDRLPISIPFFVRGRASNEQTMLDFATALNLSGGGVLLAAKHYCEPGSTLSLEIPVAFADKAYLPSLVSLLNATVLRCTSVRSY